MQVFVHKLKIEDRGDGHWWLIKRYHRCPKQLFFSEVKDAWPIPYSLLPNLIFNHAVIMAFQPALGYQLHFSNIAMSDSTSN